MNNLWFKISENIKRERKKNIVVKCNGNGEADISFVNGEVIVKKEFPCSGNMVFDLRKKNQTCNICGKILWFHKPDFWSERQAP